MAQPVMSSRKERYAAGKALRQACPRRTHAETPKRDRDPVAMVEDADKGRLANLIPVRHGRMMESPFAFFRGTANIQAADLAAGPPPSGITVQACGDSHLVNFGGFATPERELVFDVNDFDETFPAPWEWDLKRLTASVVLAGRWRSLSDADAQDAAQRAARAYRTAMTRYADCKTMDVWYDKLSMTELRDEFRLDKMTEAEIQEVTDRASDHAAEQVFHKLVDTEDGPPRIIDQPPLLYHPTGKQKSIWTTTGPYLKQYRDSLSADRQALFDRWTPVDVAFRVVGVGSVGTRCLVLLMMADQDDPLFLQIKEARASVLAPYVAAKPFDNQGQRVVVGQRLMQSASDVFLGWGRNADGTDFYIRQLRDMKTSFDITRMGARLLSSYADLCGRALARAHAKGGDPAMIAGYLGAGEAMDEAMARYAAAYADQVEADYHLFARAVRSGRLQIHSPNAELV